MRYFLPPPQFNTGEAVKIIRQLILIFVIKMLILIFVIKILFHKLELIQS